MIIIKESYESEQKELYTQLSNIRDKLRQLESRYRDVKKELNNYFKSNNYSTDDSFLVKLKKKEDNSGVKELTLQIEQLKQQIQEIEDQIQLNTLNKEEEEFKLSGLTKSDYHRKLAVKEFGYTPYFYDAGYILPNGKLLNFSGEKGKHFNIRGQDHRAISAIMGSNVGYTESLVLFMNEGNIRIMPESPGVDISSVIKPTKEQLSTIKNFINEYRDKEQFFVDFSNIKGNVVSSLSYKDRIYPQKIIQDIENFYGETT